MFVVWRRKTYGVFEIAQWQVMDGERKAEEAGKRNEDFILRSPSCYGKALSWGVIDLHLYFKNIIIIALGRND